VSAKRPNLRHLCELLGGTEGLIKTVGFKKMTNKCRMMPEGSEFYTEGAATLKQREAKVVWIQGTDSRLVLEERRERAGMW